MPQYLRPDSTSYPPSAPQGHHDGPQGYNGWKNYETWAVWSWLGNDEGLHERFMAIAQNPDSLYERTSQVEEWLRLDRNAEEHDIELSGSLVGMYTDLVCSALDNVDWRSLVEQVDEDMNADRW